MAKIAKVQIHQVGYERAVILSALTWYAQPLRVRRLGVLGAAPDVQITAMLRRHGLIEYAGSGYVLSRAGTAALAAYLSKVPLTCIAVLLALVMLVTGCSSTSSSDACNPAGTYAVTYTRDAADPGDCGILETDSATGNTDTYTVVQTGSEYSLTITGLTGGCTSTLAPACKLDLSCDTSEGSTLQFALAFSASGVTGSATIGLANAHCEANYKVTGSRR